MNFKDFQNDINALPVFDTHTHMDTGDRQCTKGLYAQNFYHICWYFWFLRELEATGYPYGSVRDITKDEYVDEAKRIQTALQQTQNTYWTNTVMRAMHNLYGVRPDGVDNILELNEVMAGNLDNPEWGNSVLAKLNIKKSAPNRIPVASAPSAKTPHCTRRNAGCTTLQRHCIRNSKGHQYVSTVKRYLYEAF